MARGDVRFSAKCNVSEQLATVSCKLTPIKKKKKRGEEKKRKRRVPDCFQGKKKMYVLGCPGLWMSKRVPIALGPSLD